MGWVGLDSVCRVKTGRKTLVSRSRRRWQRCFVGSPWSLFYVWSACCASSLEGSPTDEWTGKEQRPGSQLSAERSWAWHEDSSQDRGGSLELRLRLGLFVFEAEWGKLQAARPCSCSGEGERAGEGRGERGVDLQPLSRAGPRGERELLAEGRWQCVRGGGSRTIRARCGEELSMGSKSGWSHKGSRLPSDGVVRELSFLYIVRQGGLASSCQSSFTDP